MRQRNACALVVGLLLLSGCGGGHLYNAEDDALARQAQAAFAAAELTKSIDDERALADKISERQLAVVRRHVAALRDGWLIWLIDVPDADRAGRLEKKTKGRLQILIGDTADFDAFVTALADLPDKKESVRKARVLLEGAMGTGNERFIETAKGRLQEKRNEMKQLEAVIGKAGGELAALTRALAELGSAREELRTAIKTQTGAYRKAKKAAKPETPAGQAGFAESIRGAIAALDKPLSRVPEGAGKVLSSLGLEDLQLEGRIALLEDQLGDLDALLDAVAGGEEGADRKPTGEGAKKLEAVLSWSVPLLKEIGGAARYPRTSALLLEAERLRIDVESTRRRLQRANAIAALLEKKREAMFLETRELREVQLTLDSPDMNPKEKLNRALIAYANTWTIGRVAQEEADFGIVALRHQAALDGTEFALAQWQNLIGIPLGQLVALYGSGVTPDDLAGLAAAAGLFAIAGTGL